MRNRYTVPQNGFKHRGNQHLVPSVDFVLIEYQHLKTDVGIVLMRNQHRVPDVDSEVAQCQHLVTDVGIVFIL